MLIVKNPHYKTASIRPIFALLAMLFFTCKLLAQTDSSINFIFVPHPRSESKNIQSVLPGIEKINFSKYKLLLLGGDLTYYTSINRQSMDYLDKLFDLGSPNTLWAMGNHDLNNPKLVEEYTGRPSYYSYYYNNITFLVLNTELDAVGFKSSFISGAQLEMLTKVCDTISYSDYLIVLHGRLLWMIGNRELSPKLDSVAESTKQLDTTNFYQEVYPLLKKVKSNGVKVLCLGGDKSKINIQYESEDSITFLASTMAPEFIDSENDVLIFDYNMSKSELVWHFIPLDKVEKKTDTIVSVSNTYTSTNLKVWQSLQYNCINVIFQSNERTPFNLEIYTLQGVCVYSGTILPNVQKSISTHYSGVLLVRAQVKKQVFIKKIIVL